MRERHLHHGPDHVDPMDYMSAMHNEHAPAIAFEKLYGIKAPPGAEYIRALVVELNRVFSHGLMMGFLALDMGGLTPILYGFINRDEVVDLLSSISGQRMLFNFFPRRRRELGCQRRVHQPPVGWRVNVNKSIGDNEQLITQNEIFVQRTKGLGVLSGERAISWACRRRTCAPAACRSTCAGHPYSIYNELELDVITQPGGDTYARYLQRVAEIKQSLHLIDQIIDKMPHGPVQAQVPGIIRPKPGRAYAAIESPRGLYSVYAISDGGPNPYRFRMRDPSYITLQVDARADARAPDRRHHGRDGELGPDHGRRGQVEDFGELLLGVRRFVLATTLMLLLTVPTAFIVIQMELKMIAGDAAALRPEPDRPVRDVPEHDPRLQGAGQGRLHRPTRPTARLHHRPRGWSTWPLP